MSQPRYMRSSVDVRFRCKACGCREWGSSRQPDGSWRRSCHGARCRLSFHDSDDYLHFTVDGQRLPSRAAYNRAVYTSDPGDSVVATAAPPSPDPPRSNVIPIRPRR